MSNDILKEILLKMYYDNSKTLKENIKSNSNLLTEGWEKYPCVQTLSSVPPLNSKIQKTTLNDGSTAYTFAGITYYNNGRTFDGKKYGFYNCSSEPWASFMKDYNESKKSNYDINTWNGQKLDKNYKYGKYVSVSLNDNLMTQYDRGTKENSFYHNPLKDGWDYVNWCVWDNDSCQLIRVKSDLYDKIVPVPLPKQMTTLKVGRPWYSVWTDLVSKYGSDFRKFSVEGKNSYDLLYLKNFFLQNMDPNVGFIDQTEDYNPLSYAIMRKLGAIDTHQQVSSMTSKAYALRRQEMERKADPNRVLKIGDRDPEIESTESYIMNPTSLDVINFIKQLNKVSNVVGYTVLPEYPGIFDKNVAERIKLLFSDFDISKGMSLNQLIKLSDEKYGVNPTKEFYQGYWNSVAELKSKGFKHATCYTNNDPNVVYPIQCRNKKEHFDNSAWLEMIDINRTLTNYININLLCQRIVVGSGTSSGGDKDAGRIPNFSVSVAKDLTENKRWLADKLGFSSMFRDLNQKGKENVNKNIENLTKMDAKFCNPDYKITQEELNKIGLSLQDVKNSCDTLKTMFLKNQRPYFTYFILWDFYFGAGQSVNRGDLKGVDQRLFPNNVNLFPDGPFAFFKTYYGTDIATAVYQTIKTYTSEMYQTDCADIVPPPQPTFNIHDMCTGVELTFLALSFIPTPLSPFFMAMSTAVGFTESIIYAAEGNYHMALMLAAFSFMGAGEIAKAVKAEQAFGRLGGKEGIINISKRKLAGEILETAVEKDLKLVVEVMKPFDKQINAAVSKKLTETFEQKFADVISKSSKGWDDFGQMLTYFKLSGRIDTAKVFVQVLGVPVSLDILYLTFLGNDKSRQNSAFRGLLDGLKRPDKYNIRTGKLHVDPRTIEQIETAIKTNPDKMLLEAAKVFQKSIQQLQNFQLTEEKVKDMLINYDKAKFLRLFQVALIDEYGLSEVDQLQTPTIDEVRSCSKKYFNGHSGAGVKEIQDKLKNNWKVDFGVEGPNKDGITGEYDENMDNKVQTFIENIKKTYYLAFPNEEPLLYDGDIDCKLLKFIENYDIKKLSELTKIDMSQFTTTYLITINGTQNEISKEMYDKLQKMNNPNISTRSKSIDILNKQRTNLQLQTPKTQETPIPQERQKKNIFRKRIR